MNAPFKEKSGTLVLEVAARDIESFADILVMDNPGLIEKLNKCGFLSGIGTTAFSLSPRLARNLLRDEAHDPVFREAFCTVFGGDVIDMFHALNRHRAAQGYVGVDIKRLMRACVPVRP